MAYRFGPFVADRTTYRVLHHERPLDLTPKLLDLLFYFLDRPATLVTREELFAAVWPGANVTDNALAQAISDLRDALGDSPAAPAYIRTVARRGYRFVSAIDVEAESETASPVLGARPIAVLDFANVTGDPDIAWLRAGIAETVTSDLAALDYFRVIDRWRVVQTARRTDGSIHDVAAALGVDLVVTGSYQRVGPAIRITARVVDLITGEAVADAKVDGRLEDVFSLQDGIVNAFAHDLGLPAGQRPSGHSTRETSSLDAYRAYTEGWLKIESLDTDLTSASIGDFERAIELDPRYAMAYTGLANAELVAYEMTRVTRQPNVGALEAGLRHARHAIELDERLAEGHATLSFLLTSAGRVAEARVSAHRAVALEPENWRHQYRLGHALWGEARLGAFERTLALYPHFAYAYFEMAMVHVARGRFDAAEGLVRQGVAGRDRPTRSGERFPAIGFHWLLGAMRAARGDFDGAVPEFDRELAQGDPRRLYGREYAAVAQVARGHAELALGRLSQAVESFRGAATHVDGYVRGLVGLAAAFTARGDRAEADRALEEAEALAAIPGGATTYRPYDSPYVAASAATLRGDPAAAVAALERVLDLTPSSFVGWMLPLEPIFSELRGHPGFARALARLAERAGT